MVCGQSFNLNTLPSKNQQCYENSLILWHEAAEHVTCTLKSCLMPGLKVWAGGVSCWQCVHGKTQLSALLLHPLARAVRIMCNTQTEPCPARCSWDAQPGCVLREALLGHHQAAWEGWWAVEPVVVTRHQLSSSPTAQPCSLPIPMGWETPRWGWAAPVSPRAPPALRRTWQALPDCDNRYNNSQESPWLWSQLTEFHPPATAFLEHLILHCQLVDSINYDKWDEVPESW